MDILIVNMNTGFQLFQLQELDSKIDSSSRRIQEIEQILINDLSGDAQGTFKNLENQFLKSKSAFDELNDEILARKNKKSQSESSLYNGKITNPKELQDLQKEIAFLNDVIQKLDEELFELLVAYEESEKRLEEGRQQLHVELSEIETKKSLLLGERNQLGSFIINQQEQRNSITESIDPQSLSLYQSLRESKNGIAVAKLVEDYCSGCGSSLTASQCQQARSPGKLFQCPSCGRIVYGS